VAGPGLSQSSALAAANAGVIPPKKAPAAPLIEVQKISSTDGWVPGVGYGGTKKDVLYVHDYRLAKSGCKQEKKAIYIDGPKIGQTTFLCDVKNCSNHGGSSTGGYVSEVSPAERARRREAALKLRIQQTFRENLLVAVHGELPEKLGDGEIRLLADFVMERLDHERVKRVVKFYAWEIKKKKSYGAEYTDWNGILSDNVKKMSIPEVVKFMMIASFSGDLQVNQYDTSHKLREDAMLGRAAKLYKLNPDTYLKQAQEQLGDKAKPAAAKTKKTKVPKTSKPAKKKVKAKK
jgi:hypothetical protein